VIQTKDDLRFYRDADLAARGLTRWRTMSALWEPEAAFQRQLRRLEYLQSCRRDPLGRLWFHLAQIRFLRLSRRLGFSIPAGVFGPGLSIAHYGSIVVSGRARVGRNCRIHSDVNIGETPDGRAPVIGNNVYIGPGAKIFGPISIGDDVAIGANAVVHRDVPRGVTVGGVPARVISERGSHELVVDGCERAGRHRHDRSARLDD
jgi:serine O-acetyltransferase